jgi:hypothetical protein
MITTGKITAVEEAAKLLAFQFGEEPLELVHAKSVHNGKENCQLLPKFKMRAVYTTRDADNQILPKFKAGMVYSLK